MLLPSTMESHAVWLVTPTMMIRHHSATPLLLVVTTWLCGGRRALDAAAPKIRDKSMSCGWSMQRPLVGHCSVPVDGVKPIGVTTYNGSICPLTGAKLALPPPSQKLAAPLDGGAAQ